MHVEPRAIARKDNCLLALRYQMRSSRICYGRFGLSWLSIYGTVRLLGESLLILLVRTAILFRYIIHASHLLILLLIIHIT